ncbi:MAG: YggS family pyridoxal phosphate-dependent enzyme [Candidatus Omnitrophica bacterium]|nr:YggS family pyridoxal phosphate-dependent enzyme [Candidatus Omnitrophota bacterium]
MQELVDPFFYNYIIFFNPGMIRDNVLKIKERIREICSSTGVNPDDIRVVAVSKNRTPEEIKEVLEAGIIDIGENRVQEAFSKYINLKNIPFIRWHMVGHLQTNKVKDAVRIFDLIHSLDSLHLAERLNRHAEKINKVQEVLIEVKTSPEPHKFGIVPAGVRKFIQEIIAFKNLKIKGLMTIAPYFPEPEASRSFFRTLRELKDEINQSIEVIKLEILSMGMSNDFEVALQEGANMLRIGRRIFEGE